MIAVIVVCAAATLLSWAPLAYPSLLVNEIVSGGGSSGIYDICESLDEGTPPMFVCSAFVGLLTIALGPLLLGVVLFLVRTPLARILKAIMSRLPQAIRFLGAPLIATLIFVLGWAGIHHKTWDNVGLLPQILFPVVVGVFTFVTTRYIAGIQASLAGFCRFRDRFPRWIRLGSVLVVPLVLSILLTSAFSSGGTVRNEAFTEQVIVIVALVVGFLAVVPPSGDLLEGARKALRGRA